MTLRDCTKEELLFIINRLQIYMLSGSDHYVKMALYDVEERRYEKKNKEAQRLSTLAYQKRQEYIDLLSPYEGKRLSDIPDSVFAKAAAAMKEAQAADRKWNRLMGICIKGGKA